MIIFYSIRPVVATVIYRYMDSPVLKVLLTTKTHALVEFQTGERKGESKVIHKSSMTTIYS
jgi:hypothetical protein